MNSYTKEELTEALHAISSLISKCEKVQEKLREGSQQLSLTKNRLKAFHIASSLITNALESEIALNETDSASLEEFEKAYQSLLESISDIPVKLESLRNEGKEKTVTYKELMTQKLINNNILMFFESHGIKRKEE